MKFYSITSEASNHESLEEEYKHSREIGIVRIGDSNLFFRKKLKNYYIPYKDITRCYRRVLLVPAKMCCGSGELSVENLVVCSDERELAEIQLPGTKAAKIMMDELKTKMPHINFNKPDKTNQ